MKVYLKQIFFISLFCLGIEIIVFPVVAQEQQEVKQTQEEDTQGKVWNPRAVSIEPSAPEPLLLNFPSTSYRKELLAAMKFHNMANTIQSMVDSNDYRDTLIDLALVKRRMADLEKCNVTLLSNNFSDPQKHTLRLDISDFEGSQVSRLSTHPYLLTPSIGTAFLYVVRNALGSLWVAVFYTVLVLAAAFHGFNGLWTFISRWGIVLPTRLQTGLRNVCYCAMVIVSAMGVSTIWNIYNMA